MATAVTIEATCSDGRPLDALANLIEARTRVLGETTIDASIAITIDALKSIRARTRKSRGTVKKVTTDVSDTLSIAVQPTDMTLHWKGKTRKVIVKDRSGNEWLSVKPWIKVPPSQIRGTPVFAVILSNDRVEAWKHQKQLAYIAAPNLSEATRIITERYNRLAKKASSLARDALSHAMMTVSSRPAKLVSKKSGIISERNLVITSVKTSGFASGFCEIVVEDNLRYALDALNGGESAVATSLARAANKVTGYLQAHLETHAITDFGREFENRPFPEEMFDPESGMLIQ